MSKKILSHELTRIGTNKKISEISENSRQKTLFGCGLSALGGG